MNNITLTGFMGTGKSTVGQLVAAQLNRQFVDMDTIIEQREGRAISQIFATDGETYFRQLEADLCRELTAESGLVIATGGGALVDKTNLRVIEQGGGLVICLDCQPHALWERIGHSEDHLMLAQRNNGRFARLTTLLETRTPTYRQIKHHIDVTHLLPQEVAERVCQMISDNN